MTATAKTKIRTVRDLINTTKRQWEKRGEDAISSRRHADWWNELHRLGWKKKTAEPGETRDLYSTAVLTEQEFKELRAKIPSLEK